MNRVKNAVLCLLAIWSILPPAKAQETGRTTESEVKLEQLFIEAHRERLLGHFDEAEKLFQSVLKSDRHNAAAAYELGRLYDLNEDYQKALQYAKQAVEFDASNDWYHKFLADIYQKTGSYHDAAQIYADLVGQHPNDDYLYYKWAYLLVQANETTRAIKVYEDLEKRIGLNEDLIRRKHTLFLGLGDTQQAEAELLRLVEAFPENTDYLHLLAGFYGQIEEFDKEKETYQRILQLDPNDGKATLALARSNRQSQDDYHYLQSLKAIFIKPEVSIDDKIKQLFPFVQKIVDTGDQQLGQVALELADILEQVHPQEAKAFALYGDLLYHTGQRREAIKKYRQTLELDDTVYLVWEQLLFAYAEEGEYQALVEAAEEALVIFPNQATMYYLAGMGYGKIGKHRDAIGLLEQALLMAGRNQLLQFQAQALLGAEYHEVGQDAKSIKAFEQALQIRPLDAAVLNNFANSLAQRGEDLDRAAELIDQALKLQPDKAEYLSTKGWVLYKKKDYSAAREVFERALSQGGDEDPLILEHFGDLLYQLQETDQALLYWQQAQEKGSDAPLLEKKIANKQLYE